MGFNDTAPAKAAAFLSGSTWSQQADRRAHPLPGRAIAGGRGTHGGRAGETTTVNPWGSAEDADRWEAGNMAKVLLGRGDYTDAVKHFAGEFQRDPAGAKLYTAAVYDDMAKANPKQAAQFASQMKAAGLVEEKKAQSASAEVPTTEQTQTGETPKPKANPDDQGSEQERNDQIADNRPQKSKNITLKDKTTAVDHIAKGSDEEGVKSVDIPDHTDPIIEGQRTATELRLNNTDQARDSVSAAAVHGVANFRFLDSANQDKVMKEISKIDSDKLRGELLAKIGDIKTQPAWNERSLTDEELRAGIGSNERAAKLLEYGSAVPGAGGKLSAMSSDIFQKSADRLRQELVRRGATKDPH